MRYGMSVAALPTGPTALDVERLRDVIADEAWHIEDDEGNEVPFDVAAQTILAGLAEQPKEPTHD